MNIKICGLTCLDDAQEAERLGAYALGFIFYKKSPRYVAPEVVKSIVAELESGTKTVGVFVNESYETICQLIEETGISAIQLHGDESPDFCARFSCPVIKAFRVESEEDIVAISKYRDVVSAVLLDAKVEGLLGGTGQIFDWRLALDVVALDIPVFLAGGLGPDNVRQAAVTVQPFALDVSSGVESEPGKKDWKRLKALFLNA
jgi:phosphoribosylanthranilate isomerase